jgi:hypothetical protein
MVATSRRRLVGAAAIGAAFLVMTSGTTAAASGSCNSGFLIADSSYRGLDIQVFRIAQDLGTPFGFDHFDGISAAVDKDGDLVICVVPLNKASHNGSVVNVKDDGHKN